MEKIALSILALALAKPDPGTPKTSQPLPKATAPTVTKKIELTPQTKAALELAKIQPKPHLEAVKEVAVEIGEITTIDEPGSFRLTPREPWHDGAYLNFISANVYVGPPQPDMEPFARVRGSTTWSSWFEVSFPTAPGWAYVLDCEVAGTSSLLLNRGGAGQEPVTAHGGHLVIGLPRQSVAARAKFLVSAERSFSVSTCEVIKAR